MADLRKLKQEALDAAAAGSFRKAATCYANLEHANPSDPSWALKLGECLRKLGGHDDAIKAFERAAAAYARQDMLLKAIAVCKIILGLEPSHTRTQERLASLHAAQGGTARPEGARAAEPPTRTAPRPVGAAPTRATGAPVTASRPPVVGAAPAPPLSRVRLAALVPGASQSAQLAASSGGTAMRIPIDEGFAGALSNPTRPHKGAGRNTMARFVLPKTPFFSVLTPDLFRLAVARVELIQLAAGEVLFRQGDPGDTLYVVAWGEVAVLVPQEVARLAEGDFFGEIALLSDRPRTATVKATVDSQVLALDRSLLIDLVSASPDLLKVLLRFLRERLIATLAHTSPLFSPFTELERIALAARFQFLEIDDGLAMVEQGKKSPGLFVLLSGEAVAVASGEAVAAVGAGDVFGELSLIGGQDARASVVSRGRCFVLFLPRAEFSEVIMTHPQVLERIGEIAESRQRPIGHVDML